MNMLAWGLGAVLVLGGLLVATGAVQVGDPRAGAPAGAGLGRAESRSYGYYHDRRYESGGATDRWSNPRASARPREDAALHGTSRWDYEGPYRYGPYGSDGIDARTTGRDRRDPLVTGPEHLPDVFDTYSSADPSGGEPVGAVPSHWTSPYYDAYAGYANPYANRIRMQWGEGSGPGAADVGP